MAEACGKQDAMAQILLCKPGSYARLVLSRHQRRAQAVQRRRTVAIVLSYIRLLQVAKDFKGILNTGVEKVSMSLPHSH